MATRIIIIFFTAAFLCSCTRAGIYSSGSLRAGQDITLDSEDGVVDIVRTKVDVGRDFNARGRVIKLPARGIKAPRDINVYSH